MCCFLILDVHGERSDADVFCLRPGCNRLDPVSVSRVAFRPDLRLSSPYDDYWRHFYFATPSDVQLIELSATMHYINDSIVVLAVRDGRRRRFDCVTIGPWTDEAMIMPTPAFIHHHHHAWRTQSEDRRRRPLQLNRRRSASRLVDVIN